MSKQLPILFLQCLIIGVGVAVLTWLAYSAYVSIWIGSFAPSETVRKTQVTRLGWCAIFALVTFIAVFWLVPALRKWEKGVETGTGPINDDE